MTIEVLILPQDRHEYRSFEKEVDEVDWHQVSRCLSVLKLYSLHRISSVLKLLGACIVIMASIMFIVIVSQGDNPIYVSPTQDYKNVMYRKRQTTGQPNLCVPAPAFDTMATY